MRIFLTGATGVIGRRVVPQLVQGGHTVTAIGRSPAKRDAIERAGARSIDVDLFDGPALQRALPGHDVVLNLATHIPPSSMRMLLRSAWRENDRIRTLGSATLADAALAAGVGRFVQESFAPIYADNRDAWIDEQHSTKPVRYNRSVLDAERSARRFSDSGGAGVVLRFAGFYGPDAFHIREMLDMVRKGWAPIPGAADAFLSSISHDDAAAAVVAAIDVGPGIYNVSDDQPLIRREWIDALADSFELARPKLLPRWISHLGSLPELLSRSLRISNRRLRAASAWTPRYPSVREGFRAMAGEMRKAARGATF
jgi:nucleoside-diphosphate-sugar epimerase